MSDRVMGTIIGIFFLGATLGGFYWLWSESKPTLINFSVSEDLKKIELGSAQSAIESLIKDRENTASLPIPVPTEKMGRDNPFNNI